MIGLHFIKDRVKIDGYCDDTLLKESWHTLQKVYQTDRTIIEYSTYKGYPIRDWEYQSCLVIFEGMIFNKTGKQVQDSVNEIIDSLKLISKNSGLLLNKNIKEKINSFISEADGDFIFLISNKTEGWSVFLNDILGSIPLFYTSTDDKIVVGRDLSYLLANIKEATVCPEAIVQYAIDTHITGKYTVFKNIFKMRPAQCIVISDHQLQCMQIEIFDSVDLTFSTADQAFQTKDEAISVLKDVFLKGIKDRFESVSSYYSIYNTLSGGFDSRAVFGGLNYFEYQYTNVTYEYHVDESAVVKELLAKTGSKNKYVKLSFPNIVDLNIPDKIFKTNGLVNAFTTSVCYNDALHLKKEFLKDDGILFGGFGGEFVRHPLKYIPTNITNYLYYKTNKNILSAIAGTTPKLYKQYLDKTIKANKDQDKEAQLRHIYDDYYQNHVRGNGEDRSRMFSFTIHPLMTTPFILAIRNRLPLEWVDYQFFTDFLEAIDSRLLDAPIHSNLNLKSKKELQDIENKRNSKFQLYSKFYIKRYAGSLLRVLKKKIKKSKPDISFEELSNLNNKLNILNGDKLKKYYSDLNNDEIIKLYTLIQYFNEIDRRNIAKLQVDLAT